jgi:hypothetical protein
VADRQPDRVHESRAALAVLPRTLEVLREALATPTYHLLLCGPAESWNSHQLAALSERYADLVAVHRLARDTAAGALRDARGDAFARLGVEGAAQYLVRPDGHIGYRSGATDLRGLERYLARWLPGVG